MSLHSQALFPCRPIKMSLLIYRRAVLQVDITFHCEAAPNTLPAPAHHFPGFERAVSGAIYRRAFAGGAVNSPCSVECRGCRSYFNDQVTGRLVERSGWVCTNLSRRVYSLPVTALSLAFQRNSLSSNAINSRTVRRGWRLRTAAIMSTRVSSPCWLALRTTDCACPVFMLPRPICVARSCCCCAFFAFGFAAALCLVVAGAGAISRVVPLP